MPLGYDVGTLPRPAVAVDLVERGGVASALTLRRARFVILYC